MKALLLISVLWIMPAFALMQGKQISSDEMRDVVVRYCKQCEDDWGCLQESLAIWASPYYWENEEGKFYLIRDPDYNSLYDPACILIESNGEIKGTFGPSSNFLISIDNMFVVNFKGLPPMICYVYNIVRDRQYCGSICYRIGVEKKGGLVKRKIEGGIRRILENPAFVSLEIVPFYSYTGKELQPIINWFNSDGRRKEAVLTDKKKAERLAQRFYAREVYRIVAAECSE